MGADMADEAHVGGRRAGDGQDCRRVVAPDEVMMGWTGSKPGGGGSPGLVLVPRLCAADGCGLLASWVQTYMYRYVGGYPVPVASFSLGLGMELAHDHVTFFLNKPPSIDVHAGR